MKPFSTSLATVIAAFTFSLFSCSRNDSDGQYIAYKVVANDDTFGWLNDLNQSLNSSMKTHLEGVKYDLAVKDKYASLTNLNKHKTYLLYKVVDSLGTRFEHEEETANTETKMTLVKTKDGALVYIIDFKISVNVPAVYPAQLGGSTINLNSNYGRAICYLTPLK